MVSSQRSKWYKILGILLGVAVVLSFASMKAQADETNEADVQAARDRYNALKAEAADLDAQIAALGDLVASGQQAVSALSAQQNLNTQRAGILREQIDAKLLEIELQELLIEQTERDIEDRQRAYDESFALFTQRLVAIYKMNNQGVASTLLGVNSFSDLLHVHDTLERVSVHDTEMLEEIRVQRQALEEQKNSLEALLDELEEARGQLQEDLESLEVLNQSLGRQIDDELAQVALTQAELDDLRAAREAMTAELNRVFASLPVSGEEFVGGGEVAWPVPSHAGASYVSSYFGPRTLYGVPDYHTGIDIARGGQDSIHGASVVAAMDGEVVFVSTANASTGYGYYLILDHGGGVRTLYAHCDSISVGVGAQIAAGTPIATVGNTGNSTGPHLHFEIRINNVATDPYPYLMGQASLGI